MCVCTYTFQDKLKQKAPKETDTFTMPGADVRVQVLFSKVSVTNCYVHKSIILARVDIRQTVHALFNNSMGRTVISLTLNVFYILFFFNFI